MNKGIIRILGFSAVLAAAGAGSCFLFKSREASQPDGQKGAQDIVAKNTDLYPQFKMRYPEDSRAWGTLGQYNQNTQWVLHAESWDKQHSATQIQDKKDSSGKIEERQMKYDVYWLTLNYKTGNLKIVQTARKRETPGVQEFTYEPGSDKKSMKFHTVFTDPKKNVVWEYWQELDSKGKMTEREIGKNPFSD